MTHIICSHISIPADDIEDDAKKIPLYRITKTCLYNFDPLKPHFYIVKLGFTGVYIIFLISAQKIDCGYSLDEAVLTSTYNLCFEQKYEKYRIFLSENFHFWVVKFSVYLNRHVFVMVCIQRRPRTA